MGMIPPLIGNPYNGYIKPYYWVDAQHIWWEPGSFRWHPSTLLHRSSSRRGEVFAPWKNGPWFGKFPVLTTGKMRILLILSKISDEISRSNLGELVFQDMTFTFTNIHLMIPPCFLENGTIYKNSSVTSKRGEEAKKRGSEASFNQDPFFLGGGGEGRGRKSSELRVNFQARARGRDILLVTRLEMGSIWRWAMVEKKQVLQWLKLLM